MHRYVLTALACLLLSAQAPQEDEKKMQGTWTVISAEKGGVKAPQEAIKEIKVIIKDNELTVTKNKKSV